jgi:hypothetical protein
MNKLKEHGLTIGIAVLAVVALFLSFKWKKGNNAEKSKGKKALWAGILLVVATVGVAFKDKIKAKLAAAKA